MKDEVQIQQREAQPYAAIPMRVTMDTLSGAVDQAFPEVFGWLAEHGVAPAGPPLIRYLVIDMAAGLQIDLGVPVAAKIDGSGRMRPGILPAGRYVILRHVGPYDGLIASNAHLQHWAQEHGILLDSWETLRAQPGAPAWSTTSPTRQPSQTPQNGRPTWRTW